MKRKTLFLSLGCVLSCTALTLSCVLIAKNGLDQRVKGTDDFYTITINPSDVTTSTTYVDGNFSVYTDQLHNPVNLKFVQAGGDGDNLYLEGNEVGMIYNDIGENSEVRGMNSIVVKAANSPLIIDYGYRDGSSIDYIGSVDGTAIAAGYEYSFGTKKPNYFRIKSGSLSPSAITQIVIKYGKECEAGVNPEPVVNGIRYSLRDDDHYAVAGFSGASFANVVLEDEVNGLPVTEIWTYAFLNDHTIETINLKNIVTVRAGAFDGCSKLSNIGDYSKIATFESYAFRNCDSLTGTLTFTAPSITFLQGAFTDSDGITAVRFEDGCAATLNAACFSSMKELTSVHLGDSVAYSDDYLYNPKLATITVSEDNTKFVAVDNVLYQKNGDNLTLYRMAPNRVQTSYTMPANVTYMHAYCCHQCVTLESLIINSSVGRISDDSFYGCTALASVDLGGATEIGNYAFCACPFSSITIPSTVEGVDGRAFISCQRLVSVVFEEGCTQIAHDAFYDCELLSTLIIPASLEKAGSYEGGYGMGAIVVDCPSLAAICTRLTSGAPTDAHVDWLGGKTLLYYSSVANNDGAHWHEVGSNNAPRVWSDPMLNSQVMVLGMLFGHGPKVKKMVLSIMMLIPLLTTYIALLFQQIKTASSF